jgi:hypothetical protein
MARAAARSRKRVNAALSSTLGRLLLWTSFECADRSRADARFALAEQSSEQAGPAHPVLVQSGSQRPRFAAPAREQVRR